MYPIIRMTKEIFKAKRQPKLKLGEVHESHHICWPWDIDVFMELNNGRTLTLFDLGRLPLAVRSGFLEVLKDNGWTMTVAGSVTQYRKRTTMFQKLRMTSLTIGRDAKFLYVQQTLWRGSDAVSSAVLRMAVVGKSGIVPTDLIAEAMGAADWNPTLPPFVQSWSDAEALRVWPPTA